MNAFIKFNKGLLNLPLGVKLWMGLMVTFNMMIPLFFLDRLEAQVVLGSFVASILLMTLLTGRVGFTRLLGLGHIFWLPLLYFLWTRLNQIPADGLFSLWVPALMGINAISLVIDTVDVVSYLTGERTELVEG